MSTFTLENINLLNFTDGTNAGAGVCSVAGGMSVNGFITSTGVSAGTLQLDDGSITDDINPIISFGTNNLSTAGTITASGTVTAGATLELGGGGGNRILDSSGNIDIGSGFGDTISFNGGAVFNFPGTDGSDGQVLTTDGLGGLTFATASGGGGATDINGLADAATNPTSVTLGFEDGTLGTRSVLVGISPGFNSTQTDSVLIGFNPANNTGTMTEVIAIGTDAIGSGNFSHGQTVSIGTSTLFALAGNTVGNTAVGHEAGSAVTTGDTNTLIGYQAGNTVTTGSNVTCIGNGSTASAVDATNEVTLGNGTVTTLRCATSTIASVSDVRDKTEIEDLQYGLEFLDGIRPVEFTWDRRPLHPGDLTNPTNGTRKAGFIAQELLEAMPDGENEILDLVTESNPERIEAKYASLIPVMVKAIKDLKSEVQELRHRVDGM